MNVYTPATGALRRWEMSGYAVAVGVALLFGVALLRLPIQLSDSLVEFLSMDGQTLREVIRTQISAGSYFRPLRLGLIKILIDLSGGNFSPWFRGFHALEVLALFVLFVRMLRPRTATEAAVVPLALAMIAGSHLFLDIFREAFPVNHFLTIAVCAVAAVNLVQSHGGWFVDAAAVLLLTFAVATLESGLLIWVIFIAAYAAGYRGVSARGLGAVTFVFLSYFAVRFVFLGGTMPAIGERDSGFLLAAPGGAEMQRLFGDSPWMLYAYNFASAVGCALFAEPRSGTFVLTRSLLAGDVRPWQLLTVATSVVTTAMIAWHVATRIRAWRPGRLEGPERLVAMFLVLLPANAMFDIVYEKDVVLSVAGIFYAAAAAIAVERIVRWASASTGVRPALACAVVLVLASAWAFRSIGTQYRLREVAATDRNDWAYYDQWQRKQGTIALTTSGQHRSWQTLYDDAIWRWHVPPSIESRFLDDWSDPLQ